MTNVAVLNNTGEGDPKWGTSVIVNGRPIPELANIHLEHRAGHSVVTNIEMNSFGNYCIVFNTDEVNVRINVLPGYELVARQIGHNEISYTAKVAGR